MIKFCVILAVYGVLPLLTQSSPTGEVKELKKYFFSHDQMEPQEGKKACKTAFPIGDGQLVSIEDRTKAKEFHDAMRDNGDIAGTYYWTSASCSNGEYVWGNDQPLGNFMTWEDGTPNGCNDNYLVAVKRQSGSLVFTLSSNTDERKVACERVTKRCSENERENSNF